MYLLAQVYLPLDFLAVIMDSCSFYLFTTLGPEWMIFLNESQTFI